MVLSIKYVLFNKKDDVNSLCCVVMKYLHYIVIKKILYSQVTGGFTAINQFKNDDE